MPSCLVLMYHAFGERSAAADPHNLFVPVERFAEQLDRLLRRWRLLDLDEYLAGLERGSWPRRSALLTIDDGHASTLEIAPLLAERDVPAVLYIPPGRLGGTTGWMPAMPDAPIMSASELVDLIATTRIEVGAHGWDHRDCVGLDPDQLRREVVDSADELERLLGVRPRTFAYPRGLWDDASRAAVEAAGYALAFATTSDGGRYAVPRIDVNATDTARTFALKTSGWWGPVATMAARTPRLRAAMHRVIGSARG